MLRLSLVRTADRWHYMPLQNKIINTSRSKFDKNKLPQTNYYMDRGLNLKLNSINIPQSYLIDPDIL